MYVCLSFKQDIQSAIPKPCIASVIVSTDVLQYFSVVAIPVPDLSLDPYFTPVPISFAPASVATGSAAPSPPMQRPAGR